MQIDHRIRMFVGHILNPRVPGIACIVHNDIDAPKTVERRLDQLGRKCGVGHIATYYNRLAASIANSVSGLLGMSGIHVAYPHPSTLPAPHFCSTPSHTTPASLP